MPMETKPKRETWASWLIGAGVDADAAEELAARDPLTRDQVIAELSRRGIRMTRADFLNLQGDGHLPYGRRTWVHGQQTTVAPAWAVDVIQHMRQLQDQGRRLSEIAPKLRRFALERFAPELGYENPEELVDVAPALQAVARAHERRTGRPVVRVEARLDSVDGTSRLSVSVCDQEGHWMTYGDP